MVLFFRRLTTTTTVPVFLSALGRPSIPLNMTNHHRTTYSHLVVVFVVVALVQQFRALQSLHKKEEEENCQNCIKFIIYATNFSAAAPRIKSAVK